MVATTQNEPSTPFAVSRPIVALSPVTKLFKQCAAKCEYALLQ
jgi:hypothetical protein